MLMRMIPRSTAGQIDLFLSKRHVCRRKPREQWLALMPNTHEGYVTWEEFERIQALIRENLPGAEKTRCC
jgi:hypothetical protein